MTPFIWPAGTGALALGTLLWGAYDPNSPLFGPVIGHGRRDGKVCYLTFDDGPNPRATPPILETLAVTGVAATFFQVGAHVRRFPDVARQVAARGHAIGNHTYSHVKLHRRGPARVRAELQQAHETIAQVTGREPQVFRAPHGYRNPFVGREVRRLGYRVFGWSFGVWDSALPGAEEIRRRVARKLSPGAIILLHDGDGYDPDGDRTQTAAALPGIVADACERGYEFRPLSDLLA